MKGLFSELDARGVPLVVAELTDGVRRQLERYGHDAILRDGASFDTVGDAVDAFAGRSATA